MSLFNFNKNSCNKNVYLVVEENPDLVSKPKIICATLSSSVANRMCMDPFIHRSVQSVPLIDDYSKSKFGPNQVPQIDPLNPLNPDDDLFPKTFPKKPDKNKWLKHIDLENPFDPLATPKSDIDNPFAPKKPNTYFEM